MGCRLGLLAALSLLLGACGAPVADNPTTGGTAAVSYPTTRPPDPTPPLRVTGRRLDVAAPTVTTSAATNGFRQDIGPFMLLGLELPDGGCWELTGHYAGRSLHFVVRVR